MNPVAAPPVDRFATPAVHIGNADMMAEHWNSLPNDHARRNAFNDLCRALSACDEVTAVIDPTPLTMGRAPRGYTEFFDCFGTVGQQLTEGQRTFLTTTCFPAGCAVTFLDAEGSAAKQRDRAALKQSWVASGFHMGASYTLYDGAID